MNVIDVGDLKDQLDKLIDWLEAGEVVHITSDGQPFACATADVLPLPQGEPINDSPL